jgi:hypothetical protein
MKKIFIAALLLSVLPFVGCNKPEVIPAPANTGNMEIHFTGIINGSDVEWTKNVNGYKAIITDSARPYFDPMTSQSYLNLAYFCTMGSESKVSRISIGLGSIQQDPTLGTRPNTTTFKAFMDANLIPVYSDTALVGFEVRYKNEQGDLFRSDEAVPGFVEFTDLEEKEDANGEYIQFKCTFSCVVKHWGKTVSTPLADSVLATATIQNAVLTGYFKR